MEEETTVMEANRSPGNVSCLEAREVLSDLIDVRRGEIPHPDGTPLAQPGKRAAVELHVAGCAACREELRLLEEAGAAFGEYAVGEPSAQHFAEYGKLVRARMERSGVSVPFEEPVTVAPKRRSRITWAITFGAAALAAASVFLILSSIVPFNNTAKNEVAVAQRGTPSPRTAPTPRWVVPSDSSTPMRVMVPNPKDQQLVAEDFVNNPTQPDGLKGLRDREGQYGYLVFGERIGPNERPLLGVELKTTREQAQDDSQRLGLLVYRVIPGTPAQVMGLQKGDYIIGVNDEKIANGAVEDTVKFLSGVRHAGAETPVRLEVLRPMSGGHMYIIREGVLGDYGP